MSAHVRWTPNEEVPNNAIVWMLPKHKMGVAGDVLVRVYHMPVLGGKKIFVFRFSFHTAYLEGGALSLSEADVCNGEGERGGGGKGGGGERRERGSARCERGRGTNISFSLSFFPFSQLTTEKRYIKHK